MDISQYELLHDLVIIKPDEAKAETEGGLLLSEEGKKKPTTGIVEKIGPGVQAPDTGVWIEMAVIPSDHVIYDSFAAVPFLDTEYVIIEQGYIKAKIKK